MLWRIIICVCIIPAYLTLETTTTTPIQPTADPSDSAESSDPSAERRADSDEPPEGYYAFVESPNATPPRVRSPPYRAVETECPEARDHKPHVTADNLCGDLNRGTIPRNPMGHQLNGEPYPFEVFRNATLRFLSRALPVLRSDPALPRLATIPLPRDTMPDQHHHHQGDHLHDNSVKRHRRSAYFETDSTVEEVPQVEPIAEPRETKKFCDNNGVLCMLYRAINGDSSSATLERREDPGANAGQTTAPHSPAHKYEGPPTPCPARVEYATPVFARNYQGVWRYVVQIPYEGYFTQTIEVTRCRGSRCHYLEGGCLSSPRWVSLLVGELHYPSPAASPAPPVVATQPSQQDFQNYQQYLQKRSGAAPEEAADKPTHCDGHDEMGCYQVRLYYDWFLVPGSCKCWRPDYFARYVRRTHHSLEL